jgi:hypothetical protein
MTNVKIVSIFFNEECDLIFFEMMRMKPWEERVILYMAYAARLDNISTLQYRLKGLRINVLNKRELEKKLFQGKVM